jgi:hypothetical protein
VQDKGVSGAPFENLHRRTYKRGDIGIALRCASMISYDIMVSVEILTRCSYEIFTAKFVQVVKIHL